MKIREGISPAQNNRNSKEGQDLDVLIAQWSWYPGYLLYNNFLCNAGFPGRVVPLPRWDQAHAQVCSRSTSSFSELLEHFLRMHVSAGFKPRAGGVARAHAPGARPFSDCSPILSSRQTSGSRIPFQIVTASRSAPVFYQSRKSILQF